MLLITFNALFYKELNFQGIFNYVTSLVPLPSGNYILVMHGPWPNGFNGNLEYNTLVKLDSLGNVISHKAFGISSSNTRFLEVFKLVPINNYQRIVGFGYINFDRTTVSGSDPIYMIFDTNLNPIALYNLQSTNRNGLGFDAYILSDGKLFGWGFGTSGSDFPYDFHGAFFTSINIGSGVNYFWTGPANVGNLLSSGVRGEVKNDTFIFYLLRNIFYYNRPHPYFTSNRGKFNLFFFNTQNPYNYWAKSYRVSIFSDYLKEWIGGYLPFNSSDPEHYAVLAGDQNNELINGRSVDILVENNGFVIVANGGLWYDSTLCTYSSNRYDWVFFKQDRIFIIKFDNNGNLIWAKRLVFPGINWTRGGIRRSVCIKFPSRDTLIYINYLNHQIKIFGVLRIGDSYIIGGVKYIDSTCVATRVGNYYYCYAPPKRIFGKPFLIKVDTLGNFKWGYYYDIPNPSYPFFFIHENLNRAIVKNFNNDIIMFGTIGNNTNTYVSGVVIKFDSAGNSCLNRTSFTLNTEIVDWAADDPSGYYGIGPWGFTHDGWAVSVMTGLTFSGLTCIITPISSSENNNKDCFDIRKNKIIFNTNMYYKIYSIDGKLIKSGNSKEVKLKEGAYLIEIRNRRVKVIVP